MPGEKIVSNYATYLTIIPIILGILGFVLGVYNTYIAHVRDKVNLKVSVSLKIVNANGVSPITKDMLSKFPTEEREEFLNKNNIVINITNLSDFPVYIDEIGLIKDRKFSSGAPKIAVSVLVRGAQNLNLATGYIVFTPFELRGRDTIMLHLSNISLKLGELRKEGYNMVYVKSACGTINFTDINEVFSSLL